MDKLDCLAGSIWDSLLKLCPPVETKTSPKPPTEPPLAVVVQLKATAPTAQASSVMLLNPALWVFVMLATLGSALALALWFIIYRRQTRHSSATEDAEPQQEPLQKTEPPATIHLSPPERNSQAEMLQRAAWGPSGCPHLHMGAQTVSKWEESFTSCTNPAKHAGTDGGRGPPSSSTMMEHRIPLPATELGGTALVTTKTV